MPTTGPRLWAVCAHVVESHTTLSSSHRIARLEFRTSVTGHYSMSTIGTGEGRTGKLPALSLPSIAANLSTFWLIMPRSSTSKLTTWQLYNHLHLALHHTLKSWAITVASKSPSASQSSKTVVSAKACLLSKSDLSLIQPTIR